MKKYFVVSDVHSFYNEMIEALAAAGYDKNNPNHIFVSLGDLFDRGPDTVKCLNFVTSLSDDRKILIRGNHEDLLEEVFRRGYFDRCDIHNGTNLTFAQLANTDNREESIAICRYNEDLKRYLYDCRNYYEVGNNIFVHGWVPADYDVDNGWTIRDNWREAKKWDWEAARWFNGMSVWAFGGEVEGKTVWCGHWHSAWGHKYLHGFDEIRYDIFSDKGIKCLDACTVLSHKVNVGVIKINENFC